MEKVEFTKERETLLFTLYGKAQHSRSRDPILPDRWAEEAVNQIDYDFSQFRLRGYESLSIALRSKQFDVWTAAYLADHAQATVLHLGCGLDSRVFRLDPPASVLWFDVDFPEVVDLRRRLYPERSSYRLVGSPLSELGWLDDVPRDHPALMVAEGVTQYLSEDTMKQILNRITAHFPGGQMVFDAYSHQLVRQLARRQTSLKGTGATFRWGIDDAREITTLDPHLELVMESRTSDFAGYPKLPLAMRALIRVMDAIPSVRRMNRGLIYRF